MEKIDTIEQKPEKYTSIEHEVFFNIVNILFLVT